MISSQLLRVLFLLLASINLAKAQDNVGLRFVFGTLHPQGDKMAFLMPNKLDENAVAVLNWGFIGSYQRYIYKKRFSLKVAQGAYSDCARLFAGHTHLGFRVNFLNGRKHSLEFGFGPTFVYRESWNRFEGYIQDTKLLKNTKNWQWNFVWYGGELEYDYSISKNLDLNINCIPGYPKFFTFAVGARYWLRPIRSNREFNGKTF
jgi:hypothetical protein